MFQFKMQKNENVVICISKIEMISKQLSDLGEKMLKFIHHGKNHLYITSEL
jgi:hypothetical protein